MRKYLYIIIIAVFTTLVLSACGMEGTGDSAITVDTNKCISCRACEKVCPFDAIHLYGADNKPVIDPTKCMSCGKCIQVCPADAISGRPK